MLRFVVEVHEVRYGQAIDLREYVTLDADIPELESMLRRGGIGEDGFVSWRMLGVEVLDDRTEARNAE